jgi:hypothetical protein
LDLHVATKRDGDIVYDALMEEFEGHVYEHIWQKPGHYDHIHFSTYPKGWLTPPCAGGTQRIKYEDGTVVNGPFPLTIEGDDMAILTDAEQTELKNWLRFLRDMGSNVGYIKYLIPELRAGIVNKDELVAAINAIDGTDVVVDDVIAEIVTRLEA